MSDHIWSDACHVVPAASRKAVFSRAWFACATPDSMPLSHTVIMCVACQCSTVTPGRRLPKEVQQDNFNQRVFNSCCCLCAQSYNMKHPATSARSPRGPALSKNWCRGIKDDVLQWLRQTDATLQSNVACPQHCSVLQASLALPETVKLSHPSVSLLQQNQRQQALRLQAS